MVVHRYYLYLIGVGTGLALIGLVGTVANVWPTEILTEILIVFGGGLVASAIFSMVLFGRQPLEVDELTQRKSYHSRAVSWWVTFSVLLLLGIINLLRPIQFELAFLLLLATMLFSWYGTELVLRRFLEQL